MRLWLYIACSALWWWVDHVWQRSLIVRNDAHLKLLGAIGTASGYFVWRLWCLSWTGWHDWNLGVFSGWRICRYTNDTDVVVVCRITLIIKVKATPYASKCPSLYLFPPPKNSIYPCIKAFTVAQHKVCISIHQGLFCSFRSSKVLNL